MIAKRSRSDLYRVLDAPLRLVAVFVILLSALSLQTAAPAMASSVLDDGTTPWLSSGGTDGMVGPLATTIGLVAAEDTYMSAANTTTNYGSSTTLEIDGTTTTTRRGALLKWDLSSIPPYATITSANVILNVTDTSTVAYNLYQLRRFWTEDMANWNVYQGSNAWTSAGAASTTGDNYGTNLWNATTSSWSSTGSRTVALNSSGVSVLNGWLANPSSNYGFTIQSYTGTSNNLIISSSESSTPANRPQLSITYDVPSAPTIAVVGTLSSFTSTPGVGSSEQSFLAYGDSLTGAITITAPTGFQVSTTSGSGFDTSLTLTPSSGTVAKTRIYVRQFSASNGDFSGNITLTSSGAVTQNVAVSGTVSNCATASLVATADTFMNSGSTKGNYNFGASATLELNPYYSAGTNDQQRSILLKWDLSSIPSDATISAASLSFYVTLTENAYAYSLYNMRARAWLEGSNRGSTGSGASWNYFDAGSSSWGTAGAANTTSDRYDTNLWSAVASDFNTAGNKTFTLNASGVSVLQEWLNTPSSNYGLTIQNYSGTATGSWSAASRENEFGFTKPTLNVTYCLSTAPTIKTTGTLTAFTAPVGQNSTEQSYTVSGTNLTDPIVITAPTDFQISTTSGSGFGSTVTLTPTGGTVATTTIYVIFNRSSAGTSSGNITHTSTGATTQNVAVSGTASIYYTLTATAQPSAGGTITLNPSSGSYTSGTVVTVTAAANSGYMFTGWSGDLTGTTNPTTITMDGNKSITAGFTAATCTTANLVASEDTYMSANDVTYNNGGNTEIHVDNTTGTSRRGALLRWDVSSIPSNAVVSAASMTVYVTDASSLVFNLYNMRRDWIEGTSTQAASSTSANWNTYDGVNSWGTVGAASTSADRYDVNLWGAGTSSFSSTGSRTVSLNSDGIAVVQGWITGAITNYGLTMQNYSGSTSNAVFFSSSEATTVANRPNLNITYCAPTGPNITVTGTLSAFTGVPGTPSAAQSYTVSGAGLTDPIIITAPADFEISLSSGSGYTSSLNLTPSGGSVASTTIYVRFNRSTEGTSSGNITHVSAGATTRNLAVSGTASYCSTVSLVAAEDTYLSANDVTFNNGGNTQLHVDNTTGTSRRTTLLRWDLSSIPTNATVSTASLGLYVEDASPLVFNLYNMRRSWVEGTGNRTASTTSANWNTYDGTNSWGTVGAASTTLDRYDTNLWSAGTTSFSTTGSKTEALNADGIAVVQGWINGTLTNYGLILQNYSGTTSDAVYFSSSEATTAANRPDLNITYCIPSTTPNITVTGTLSAFISLAGVPSAEQTYTVAGEYLTTDLVITAPTDFEISTTSGSGFGSTITLTPSSGTVASTTIYVRMMRATAGTSSGNITHTSTGATTRTLAVTGTAYVPTISTTGTLTSFATTVGTPSAAQTYSVAGTHLTDNILITPPAGFELSTDGSTYSSSLILTQTGGTVPPTTIYVRLIGAVVGSYGGNIIHTSSGATTVNLAVTGTVDTPTCYVLTRSHTGSGTTPTASPTNSTGCAEGSYYAGASITLSGAVPDSGYAISGWTGTSNDASTADSNSLIMPASDHAVSVIYSLLPTCYTLTLSHTGNGTTPTASPTNSTGCTPGTYIEGQTVTLSGAVADSGWYISSWTGTNNDSSTASTNAWTMTAADHAAAVNYAQTNVAPNAPVLVQPPDDSTNQSTSPTLQVTASDPNAADTNLTVRFYGRPVSTEGEDFTLVLIPDTQNMSQYYPSVFSSATAWIASHKTSNNIVFVTHAGDVVNTSSSTTEYANADAAIDNLDAGSVWYSISTGNHDIAYGTTYYSNYFGVSRYSNYLYSNGFWFGGSYDDYNTYSLFSASGNDFILINLQYNPSTAVIAWADSLLTTYSNRRAIVEQHDLLNLNNTWNNQTSYNTLRSHANLFMMLCGHMHSSSDGAAYIAGTGTDGHTIHVVLADYQDYPNGGNGYLRFFRFSPANDMIYMTTYSPYIDASITNTSNYDTANLAYDLTNGSAGPYILLGTVTTANGSSASITWNGLDSNTEYEWYATVSDSALTTTGPTWSFTTGTGTNVAPVITEGASTSVTMSEDGSPTPFSLTLNATDGNPTDILTWSISTAASHGTASATGTGFSKVIGYTPAANYYGTDSFVVMVSDGAGGTDTITVNVTITPVNDAPVITEGSAIGVTMSEDGAPTAFSLTLHAMDVDTGDTLTWSISSPASHGTASASGTGTSMVVGYTPVADYSGPDSFIVQVTDGSAIASITVSVTINAVNDAPVITEGVSTSVIMSEDGSPTAFSLTLNAIDIDSSTLTWSISTPASHGTASASGTGLSMAIGYAPATNYNGSDMFVVQVSDGSLTDTITVNVTIEPVNDAPTCADTVLTTPQDTAGDAVPLCTDVDAGDTLTYSIIAQPVNGGTASVVSGLLHYVPLSGYSGPDSFTYRANDSHIDSNTSTVTVTVTPSIPTFSIDLLAGWNLVSFRLHPTSTLIADVLSSVAGNYDLVYAWDASGAHSGSGNWMKADNDPLSPDDLLTLDETQGFWIHMTAADTLVITGSAPSTTTIPLYITGGTWNLVSYPAATARVLPDALSTNGLGTSNFLIFSYRPVDSVDPWKMYDRSAEPYANDLLSMTAGWGYWIQVQAPATWNIPY